MRELRGMVKGQRQRQRNGGVMVGGTAKCGKDRGYMRGRKMPTVQSVAIVHRRRRKCYVR